MPVRQLIREIQDHVQPLLELALAPDHRAHVRHIQAAATALMGMAAPDEGGGSAGDPPSGAMPGPTEVDAAPEADEGSSGLAVFSAIGPLHVLLVEDNPFTQKLMSRLLTMRGHRIAVAAHGREALALLEETEARADGFDMVLMDIRMPVLDGFETALAIRQREAERDGGRRLPIIAVTVLTGEEDRQRALQVGMDAFHCKPVQANQLFAEMERLAVPMVHVVPQVPAAAGSPPVSARATTDEEAVHMELDMGVLLKTVENDWSLLGEIVDLYRMDAPRQLQRIQDGIDHNDADRVREAAHSLKGASGAFGETPTYALAFQLEQAGRNGNLQEAGRLLARLQRSIVALEKALCLELSKHNVDKRVDGLTRTP
ncbi:MAG: response regulator [Magnetococcus sp. DMHC-8]